MLQVHTKKVLSAAVVLVTHFVFVDQHSYIYFSKNSNTLRIENKIVGLHSILAEWADSFLMIDRSSKFFSISRKFNGIA
jgi:hypothetical protein